MTELEILEKHLVDRWFVWYKKKNKNPFYARFTEVGYESMGIYYNPRTKHFSRFKITDIYQLRGFTLAGPAIVSDIEKIYSRWNIKKALRRKPY